MPKIGIDLRPLQSGSRFRGIGQVLIQVTNQLLKHFDENNERFEVFFYQENNEKFTDPEQLLNIPTALNWQKVITNEDRTSEGTFSKLNKYLAKKNKIETNFLDGFIQFDFKYGVPTDTATLLIEHDLVLPLFWNRYYDNFVAKMPASFLWKNQVASKLFKTFYVKNRREIVNSANQIVAISETTKNDLIKLLDVPAEKISVIYHGIEEISDVEGGQKNAFLTKPFLFFIGGTDGRREIDQLVHAFDQLKNDGHDIQLALAGADFKSLESIKEPSIATAIKNSNYQKDILLIGFVDEYTKAKLYSETQAFVFPSLYEGFGLPLLEAMQRHALVITYDNSAIREIGQDYVIYANNGGELFSTIQNVLKMNPTEATTMKQRAFEYTKSFSWQKSGQQYFELIAEMTNNK
ncbi:MAG: glycosyltransferase family 4 protein [Lactobacillaceae bacterium]|jgi:glycosyltransferase involved in cell wall biosynthesis|nr:glycosyltransferase family 4 protein [Lactobacillaceae bacterium]